MNPELREWHESRSLHARDQFVARMCRVFHFADAMGIAGEAAQIPVEWVDADEWEAIEQALAAAISTSHVARNDAATGVDGLTRNERSIESLEDEEEVRGERSKRVLRTLPAWGQKTQVKEAESRVRSEPRLEPEIEAKIESHSTEVEPVVVQTNLSQLTDSWAIARNTIGVDSKAKVQSRSLYLHFKGRLVYSKTYVEVDEAAHAIWEMIGEKRGGSPGNVAVGFDFEWKTSFQRGGAPGKVAVVQLCLDSGRCDVMHIAHSGIPPSLVNILEDPSILKTGVGSHGDASKLQRDYGIHTRGILDLSEMARQKLGRGWQSWSLSSLAEELTCKKVVSAQSLGIPMWLKLFKVEKVPSIRCGDWEACPLSPPQLQYAATDAFVSLYLYQILETFCNRVLKKEESRSDLPGLMQQDFP